MNIILVDDHKILREGLKGLIENEPGLNVIAEAATGDEAVKLVERYHPDLVIMDVMMPGMNGITATQLIHDCYQSTKVLALSMYTNPNLVVEIMRAGAKGFLTKDCAYDELTQAIREVVTNHSYIGKNLRDSVSALLIDSISGDPAELPENKLSDREIEVLKLIVDGKTNKEAATMLNLSPNTIRCHRHSIMKKLSVKNAVELTKYAMQKGYIEKLPL